MVEAFLSGGFLHLAANMSVISCLRVIRVETCLNHINVIGLNPESSRVIQSQVYINAAVMRSTSTRSTAPMSPQLSGTSQTQTDSDEEDQHPRAQADAGAEIARLKRRLAASQEEIKELSQGRTKKPPYVDLFNLFGLLLY